MAHAAVMEGKEKYGRVHYMIRTNLFKGLKDGKMNIGSIIDDERFKMKLPQVCSYCGSNKSLSVDHLIPIIFHFLFIRFQANSHYPRN
jgi:hypothetical protein